MNEKAYGKNTLSDLLEKIFCDNNELMELKKGIDAVYKNEIHPKQLRIMFATFLDNIQTKVEGLFPFYYQLNNKNNQQDSFSLSQTDQDILRNELEETKIELKRKNELLEIVKERIEKINNNIPAKT